MKIQIIGYSGSGKSTLAKILANHYQIPCLHLDNTKFYGEWQERSAEEQEEMVFDFLNNNPRGWVIDGNYSDIATNRFNISDLTIFLNYNRLYCYYQCQKRYYRYKGVNRESCPCVEKFDWEFKKWLLYHGRTKKRKQKHLNNLNKTNGQTLIFKNRKSLIKFLNNNDIKYEPFI